jgi:hypothetical protein
MALTRYKHDTGSTIGTTEYSLVNDSTTIASDTTDGAFALDLDVGAMVAGDEYEVALYEKGHDSDTAVRFVLATLVGVIPGGKFTTPPFTLGNGWDFTVKKILGTDRSIGWSIWQWT